MVYGVFIEKVLSHCDYLTLSLCLQLLSGYASDLHSPLTTLTHKVKDQALSRHAVIGRLLAVVKRALSEK